MSQRSEAISFLTLPLKLTLYTDPVEGICHDDQKLAYVFVSSEENLELWEKRMKEH